MSGASSEEAAEPEDPEFAVPEYVELSPAEAARETALCSQTLRRIERMILIAGIATSVAALWPLGWQVTAGLLLGTALGWINFRWLAASVNAIAERIVNPSTPRTGAPGTPSKGQSRERGTLSGAPSGATIVARGVGRIGLIALVAYGIFECSVRGLMGFLAGLAMPVLAMMCEAVYEFVVSTRRPS